jgi:polar amino acid transport system substrate-binding protein
MRRFPVIAGLVLALLPVVAHADTITLVADPWCPYNCDPAGGKVGYAVEIAKAVFEKAGHTVEYKVLPWTRALAETRAGKIDGAVGAGTTDKEGLILPKEEIALSQNGAYVKASSSWAYKDIKGLEPVVTGVVLDYTYAGEFGEYVTANGKNAKRIVASAGNNALEQNLRRMIAGRGIDVVVDDTAVVSYNLKELNLAAEIKSAGTIGEPDPIYIGFSAAKPTAQAYADLLDKGIAELRTSGKLAEILGKYGLKDWK